MAVLDELFVRLGYDVDQDKIDDFNKGVEQTASIMKKLVLSGFAAATAFGIMARQVSKTQTETAVLAKTFGLSANTLETYIRASQDLTGSGEQAKTVISSLSQTLNAFQRSAGREAPGDKFFTALSELKLNPTDFLNLDVESAIKVLNAAFARFKGSDQTKFDIAGRLNIASGFEFISTPINRFLQELKENTTNIDYAKLRKVNESFVDFTQSMSDLAAIFTATFSTQIRAVVDTLTSWTNAFSKFVGNDRPKLSRRERNQAAFKARGNSNTESEWLSSVFKDIGDFFTPKRGSGKGGRPSPPLAQSQQARDQLLSTLSGGLFGQDSNQSGGQNIIINQTNNIDQTITGIDGQTAMNAANGAASKRSNQFALDALENGVKK